MVVSMAVIYSAMSELQSVSHYEELIDFEFYLSTDVIEASDDIKELGIIRLVKLQRRAVTQHGTSQTLFQIVLNADGSRMTFDVRQS